jgi:hypothetical protein
MTCLIAPKVPVSADITLPPRGVSQELWQAFQEVAISSIDGGDRNLRWNTSPAFYIAGDPTVEDNNTFRSTLYEIFKYCANISPGIATTEPIEGAIFHYVPVSKFKSIIPEVPADVTTSYSWSLYRLNSGLKKFTAVHSTATSQSSRDVSTQINVYRAMGLRGYTKSLNANMFSWTFPKLGVITASELDKQIIKLYCSTYSRSWDTSQQTFDAISSAWTKKSNIPIMDLNIKVGEYRNQLNFSFEFNPSSALDNQVTGIGYNISGANGMTVKSGRIDISENLFKSYQVILSGIKDGSRYKIEAYPLNATGSGSLSKAEGRAGTTPAPADINSTNATEASDEIVDARAAAADAKKAALSALSEYARFQSDCLEVSSEFNQDIQDLYDATSLSSYCRQLDSEVASLNAKLGALDPAKAMSTDDANVLTDTANLYSEDADAFVAQIQDIMDELRSMENQIVLLAKSLAPLELVETSVIDPWNSLKERLALIPQSSQTTIKKTQNYKSALSYASQVQKITETRDAQLELLALVDSPSQLQPIVSRLSGLIVNTAQIISFKKHLVAINKLIPANVCQKGALVVLASKSGKCAKGFELIPTL